MKKIFVLWTVMTVMLLVAACGEEETNSGGNPADTVTTKLRIAGQGANGIRFLSGTTATNSGDLTLDKNMNFGGSIVSLGTVSGVGQITTVPSNGFVGAAAADKNNGFVVKSSDGSNLFYAVFVKNLTVSTIGGVIGVTIDWRPLTTLSSIEITPKGQVITRPNNTCSFTFAFKAMGTNSDGSSKNDISGLVQWSTSDPAGLFELGSANDGVFFLGASGCGTESTLGTWTVSAVEPQSGLMASTDYMIQ